METGEAFPSAETLAAGVSKKWYPCDGNYNIGRCTGPVMYCSPYDPDGDGKGYTADEEANAVYKDILFGSDNWKPNWDPVIKEDATAYDIAKTLKSKGLIEDTLVFVIQEKLSNYSGKMRPGTYLLSTAYTPTRIMGILAGDAEQEGVTS